MKKQVIINADLSAEKTDEIVTALNEMFEGTSFLAEAISYDVQSASGNKTVMNSIEIMDFLNNYYFTFGTNEQYPYRDGYLIVKAENANDVVQKYRSRYPDIDDGIINCAFIYSEDQWMEISKNTSRNMVCHEIIR